LLYGFASETERAAFRELIKISGVGPRTALSVFSGMSVGELSQAVTLQEAGRLVKVPGIGKKTAERLLLELKGKLGADMGAPASARWPAMRRPIFLQALLALGYSDKEAALALKAAAGDVGVSEGIKLALKALARSRCASSSRSSSARPASATRRWTMCCCSARRGWARPR
jgi:Holliday junction DNA helicase RuvA